MVEAVCFSKEHVYVPSTKNEGLEVCKYCGLVREAENENEPFPPKGLFCPVEISGRMVNDNEDVCITLRDDDKEKAEITFLDMRRDDLTDDFGWFVEVNDPEGEWQWPLDAPHYFPTLAECVNDAIQWINKYQDPIWISAIPELQKFLSANGAG